eukprot:2463004-Prymnesium_polylepis.1
MIRPLKGQGPQIRPPPPTLDGRCALVSRRTSGSPMPVRQDRSMADGRCCRQRRYRVSTRALRCLWHE